MGLLQHREGVYNASYTENFHRKRHGMPWEASEFSMLKACFARGDSLQMICACMERPPAGVLAKLVQLGCISYDTSSGLYYIRGASAPKSVSKSQPKKENIMAKAVTIETKTFINDIDAATLTDEQIFMKIAELENVIKAYGGIANKPKKLLATIARLENNIKELVVYVDNRV